MPSVASCLPRIAVVTALALVPLSGCGGAEQPASTVGQGLAHLVPSSSLFYAEVAVRPMGKAGTDLDAMIGKFAPGQSAQGLVKRAFDDVRGHASFERDVKPWLGAHAGFALTRLPHRSGGAPGVVVLAETTNGPKALAALRRTAHGKFSHRRHAGRPYVYDAGAHVAGALIDGTLVFGSVRGLESVLDTATSGSGLGDQARYKHVVDTVDDDAIGVAYGDVRRLVKLAQRSALSQAERGQVNAASRAIELHGSDTIAAGAVVTRGSVKLRLATTGSGHDLGAGGPAQLAALPASSWTALGTGNLGKAIGIGLDGVRGLTGSGYDVGAGIESFRRRTDIDVEKDLLPWMGAAGLFVRGTSATDIGGALVVQSKDPAATRAVMGKAKTLAVKDHMRPRILTTRGVDDGFSVRPRGLPVQVFVALAGERFVVAAGRAALDDALDPRAPLGDDATFKAAAAQLDDGARPTFFVDVHKVTGLLGLAATDRAAYAKAKKTLDKINTVVGGSRRVGDVSVQTIAVGVR